MEIILIPLLVIIVLLSIYIHKVKIYLKQSDCIHKNKFTHVQRSYATCEDTVITCLDCNKILSKKTDCI